MPNQGPQRRPNRIPNTQVLDAADQFRDGYLELMNLGPGSGVLLPALHCAFISMELYLKALSANEVEVPDPSFPGIATIHAAAATRTHGLEAFYDKAPPDFRTEMENRFQQKRALGAFPDLRAALKEHNSLFMASRYPYEQGQSFANIELGALAAILEVLSESARAIPVSNRP